ncbi:hypothetical protein [Streptomyces sp. NBC_01216]|uniref:hypothetical protein n=1 Tax=unclassified Streptomyces TaxID=2593676 RepID=UPI002E13790E|nr:hypothetical protein OG393_03890 [Streptomyces sp. NBC_01216]
MPASAGRGPVPAPPGRAGALVRPSAPGRELYEYGYPQDVAVAAGADAPDTVPVPTDGACQEAAS